LPTNFYSVLADHTFDIHHVIIVLVYAPPAMSPAIDHSITQSISCWSWLGNTKTRQNPQRRAAWLSIIALRLIIGYRLTTSDYILKQRLFCC